MKKFSVSFMAALFVVSFCFAASADQIGDLFNTYAQKISADRITMVVSGEPDSTGLFDEVYLEAKGANSKDIRIESSTLKEVRIDSLAVRVKGLQLNASSDWGTDGKGMEFKGFKSADATITLLSADINKVLTSQNYSFDKDGYNFHDISIDIKSTGITASGYVKQNASTNSLKAYAAALLLGADANDYPITVTGKVKISNDKEIWFDGTPTVTCSNSTIAERIRSKIDTSKALYEIPDKVLASADIDSNSIVFGDGRITVKTKTAPESITGTTYTYPAATTVTTGTGTAVTSDDISADVYTKIKTITGGNDTVSSDTTTYSGSSTNNTNITNAISKDVSGSKVNNLITVCEVKPKSAGWVMVSADLKASYKANLLKGFFVKKSSTAYGASLASLTGVSLAATGDVVEAKLTDANGNELSGSSSVSSAYVLGSLDADTEYAVVVAEGTENSGSSSSGGGCNAGIGLTAIAILAFAFFKKH